MAFFMDRANFCRTLGDVSCRRQWVRSARKTVQWTVFSGERAVAQEDEGRRSPSEQGSIPCAVREELATAVRARNRLRQRSEATIVN
ncbi:MAG: hypothetical protein IJJ80_05785 [Clostridia bacterium]|nr:hypothetical protein [Clostridia bacterium]